MVQSILENEIRLRKLELKDAEPMLEWLKDPAIYEKMQYDPSNKNVEQCIKFIKNSWRDDKNLHYAIVNSKDEYCGTISLKNIDIYNRNAELGIVVHPKMSRKGVGRKALQEIMERAFVELDLNKIYLYVRVDNERAINFYKKNGWEEEGYFKEHILIKGEYKDIKWFSMRRIEYLEKME